MTNTRRAFAALATGAVLAGGMTVASVVPAEAASASGSATMKRPWYCNYGWICP